MYRSLQLKILFFLCLMLLTSCKPATPKTSTPVTEKELNAAIDKANQSRGTLLKALLAPKPSYDFVGLKVRFIMADGSSDDNWAEAVDYYDGVLQSVCWME